MIFLRHPMPDVEPGVCYGRLDLDIAEIGHEQIQEALDTTPPIKNIIASPALRCRKLAEALAEQHGIDLAFDERLWEMHMGDWEGKPWKDINRQKSDAWLKDPFNIPTPGGESFKDVQVRVLEALQHADVETVIICHAGPIRATQMAWLGLSFEEVFAQTPPYAEAVRIWPPQAA